ncbi:hypothetical protein [Actinoplanes sp. NBRC 103695]|nr:hypothetical protein [Actinoplanes sp. NBRC 103695]
MPVPDVLVTGVRHRSNSDSRELAGTSSRSSNSRACSAETSADNR